MTFASLESLHETHFWRSKYLVNSKLTHWVSWGQRLILTRNGISFLVSNWPGVLSQRELILPSQWRAWILACLNNLWIGLSVAAYSLFKWTYSNYTAAFRHYTAMVMSQWLSLSINNSLLVITQQDCWLPMSDCIVVYVHGRQGRDSQRIWSKLEAHCEGLTTSPIPCQPLSHTSLIGLRCHGAAVNLKTLMKSSYTCTRVNYKQ